MAWQVKVFDVKSDDLSYSPRGPGGRKEPTAADCPDAHMHDDMA